MWKRWEKISASHFQVYFNQFQVDHFNKRTSKISSLCSNVFPIVVGLLLLFVCLKNKQRGCKVENFQTHTKKSLAIKIKIHIFVHSVCIVNNEPQPTYNMIHFHRANWSKQQFYLPMLPKVYDFKRMAHKRDRECTLYGIQ